VNTAEGDIRKVAKLFFSFLVVAALALGLSAEYGLADEVSKGITVEYGDKIDIKVYKAPDLSVSVEVPESGEIVYPVLGRIKVSGRDTEELARWIGSELERNGHLQNPAVMVSVTEMAQRKVFVLGAVKNPAQIVFSRSRPFYLTQALAVVGGFSENADRKDVRIVRRPPDGAVNVLHADVDAILEGGNALLDMALGDGDTIFVSEAEAIYVYGQVGNPGAYRLPPGVESTVSRVVSMAGGTTRFARTNKTHVIHRAGRTEQERVQVVDLKSVIENGQVEKDAKVYPGDIIFIPETLF
jgi:polysaccharide export outer membrane protein